jgi:Uncharacterized conserved protein
MEKTDFKKTLKTLYDAPSDRFVLIDVPVMRFVKVDGSGDPNSAPAYNQAVAWLYSISYAMKFAAKASLNRDYVVPPLEGLWWADDPSDFVKRRKERWHWTMMIMAPDFVDRELFEAAVDKTTKKLGKPPESLRFEAYDEGLSLQIMHVGSYDDEGPILAKLHDHEMPSRGLVFAGPHHEIYLGDPRKVAPSKLKTLLRQPVARAGETD